MLQIVNNFAFYQQPLMGQAGYPPAIFPIFAEMRETWEGIHI